MALPLLFALHDETDRALRAVGTTLYEFRRLSEHAACAAELDVLAVARAAARGAERRVLTRYGILRP
jgi:hypothetical protein